MISIGLSLATILATSANWANSEKFDILAVNASASRLADCCATGLLKTILMIGSVRMFLTIYYAAGPMLAQLHTHASSSHNCFAFVMTK